MWAFSGRVSLMNTHVEHRHLLNYGKVDMKSNMAVKLISTFHFMQTLTVLLYKSLADICNLPKSTTDVTWLQHVLITKNEWIVANNNIMCCPIPFPKSRTGTRRGRCQRKTRRRWTHHKPPSRSAIWCRPLWLHSRWLWFCKYRKSHTQSNMST